MNIPQFYMYRYADGNRNDFIYGQNNCEKIKTLKCNNCA